VVGHEYNVYTAVTACISVWNLNNEPKWIYIFRCQCAQIGGIVIFVPSNKLKAMGRDNNQRINASILCMSLKRAYMLREGEKRKLDGQHGN
jgi:hypothetical protein